jgi:hypothetical protein
MLPPRQCFGIALMGLGAVQCAVGLVFGGFALVLAFIGCVLMMAGGIVLAKSLLGL